MDMCHVINPIFFVHSRPCGRRVKEETPIDEPVVIKYQANDFHDPRPFKILSMNIAAPSV